MQHGWRIAITTIACMVGLAIGAQAAPAALFYSYESGGIGRIDPDGTDAGEIVDTNAQTRGIAVDATHVYWGDPGFIGRARLDGSQADGDFIATGTARPYGLAIDGGYVYWSDFDAGTIRRATIATGAVDPGWSIVGLDSPRGIAIQGSAVYWVNNGTGQLGRAPIANPAAVTYITGTASAQQGLAATATHLYYGGANAIRRANIDGTGIGILVSAPTSVFGVAVNAAHVFWVQMSGNGLMRANAADGSDVTLLHTLPFGAYGVAVGPTVGRITLGAAPSFASTVAGQTTASQDVSVTNTGEADATVTAVDVTGADADQFDLTGEDCVGATLAPGDGCTVSVAFAPTSAGVKDGGVQVTTTGTDVPTRTRSFSATALAPPAVTLGAAPAFPDQLAGTTGPDRTVTVTNSGGAPLTVSGVSLTGADAADFALVSETCTAAPVAASGSCTVTLRFGPGTAGAKAASLRVASDAASSPDDLALAATALAGPAVGFGPAPAFPDQTVGTAGPDRTVTVTNGGDAPLTVSGVTLTGTDAGAFALVSETCTSAPIAAAGSCTAVVRFAPGTTGAKAAALRVASDAASSPDDLPLAATALAVPAPPAPWPPTIFELTPHRGAPGAVVTLHGTWYGMASRVLFGDVETAFEVLGFDRIAAVVPAGAPGSTVTVRVVGPGGTSDAATFTYDEAPTLPPAPVPVPPMPSAAGCVVPDLRGDTRREARRALNAAGCRLGTVTKPRRVRPRRLTVVKQAPSAGAELPERAPVAITLGRAR